MKITHISIYHRLGLAGTVAVGIGLLVVLFILAPSTGKSHYTIKKQIQYGFTIQNKTNRTLENSEVRVHAPVKQTSTQKVLKITSSHPYELLTDKSGNQVLKYILKNLPPYAVRVIKIKALLGLSEQPAGIKAGNPKEYLRKEKYLELDHPKIREKAAALKQFGTIQTAESTHDWVAGHVKYAGYIKNERGALYALERGKGDCTEYTHLYTALNRINRIPTRMVGGYICPESRVIKPVDYHNWAEFYHGGKWHVADPQNKVFMNNYPDYIATRIIDKRPGDEGLDFDRFKVVGNGIKVKMND